MLPRIPTRLLFLLWLNHHSSGDLKRVWTKELLYFSCETEQESMYCVGADSFIVLFNPLVCYEQPRFHIIDRETNRYRKYQGEP